MFDKDAIIQLAKAEAITAANAVAAIDVTDNAIALPNDFELHDLEKYMPDRRRLRGAMTTSAIADFAEYVAGNLEPGAVAFVDQRQMAAVAVLNHGTPLKPGHADNTATLSLLQTAPYRALGAVAGGQPRTQQQIAEFMEDWQHLITCIRDTEVLEVRKGIAAVRSITIEALNKLGGEVQQLSESRTTFEKVEAKSDHGLPTIIKFKTVPYHGLAERTFDMRLGIQTGGPKPAITLRIINAEQHAEDMADELANLVRSALDGSLPVLLGSYTVKA